jgi:hypothetical protein
VVLDYPRTMHSVKKYFLPPREKLLNFDLTQNSYQAPEAEPVNAIFLGVHSYDLVAVQRLDYNFSEGHPERNYLTRRQGAVFVGVSYEPDQYHFSGSVGIDPQDPTGSDIFLTRLHDGYVVGTCNVVCPTCYCFNVEEQVDITVTRGHRERYWDGCMLREFSEVAGGEVFRESLAARQRHRVFRKFKYLSEETGQPWCVGCGRCTALCTAHISIVSIVNHLVADYERNAVAAI